jgi:hypothetical protein
VCVCLYVQECGCYVEAVQRLDAVDLVRTYWRDGRSCYVVLCGAKQCCVGSMCRRRSV